MDGNSVGLLVAAVGFALAFGVAKLVSTAVRKRRQAREQRDKLYAAAAAKEAAARQGEPPTEKLDPQWRTRMEDVLWAMLNAPEWAFSP